MLARQRQELILDEVRTTGGARCPNWSTGSACPT